MNGIVWLASYPKSGNTWLRLLLSNLLSGKDVPEDINMITLPSRHPHRVDEITEAALVDADLLNQEETDRLFAPVVRSLLEDAAEEAGGGTDLFIKLHTAYRLLDDGTPLLGRGIGRAAVYLLRDPRDVAVSLAFHNGESTDSAVTAMIATDSKMGGRMGRQNPQIPQNLLDWSGHVQSWTRQTDVPTIVCRYEDLNADTVEVFGRIVAFLGLTVPVGAVEQAISFADFAELRRQEAKGGFRERHIASTAPFFRQGRAGGWVDALTPDQAARLVAAHGEVMAEFGYL